MSIDLNKKILVFSLIVLSNRCTIYTSKHQFETRVVETPTEEYEKYYFRRNFGQFTNYVMQKGSELKTLINQGINQFVERVEEMKPQMMDHAWAWGKTMFYDEEKDEFDFEYLDIPEDESEGRQLPYVPNNLHPGATLIIGEDFMANIKDIIIPEILDVFFDEPLDLQLDYKFVVLDKLYLGFQNLHMDAVGVEFSEEHNSILFRFPQVPLNFWVQLTVRLPFENTLTGKVHGSFNMHNPVIGLVFDKDMHNQYFHPRLRLVMDDNFQLENSHFDLRSAFPYMPEWLFDSIIWLVKGQITSAIQNYLKEQFMTGGSTLLYYILEEYYPENVSLGLEGVFINLLFLRTPVVNADNLTLYLTGETFTLKEEGISSPEQYIPKGSTRSFVPVYLSDQNYNVQLSLNFPTFTKLLSSILNNLYIPIEVFAVNKLGIHFIGFMMDPSNFVDVKNGGMSLNNVHVMLIHKRKETIKFTAVLSMVFNVVYLDLMTGKIKLNIRNFNITFDMATEALVQGLSLAGFDLKFLIYEHINNLELEVESLKVQMKPGMHMSPLCMLAESNVASFLTGVFFETTGRNRTFFLEEMRPKTKMMRRAEELVS